MVAHSVAQTDSCQPGKHHVDKARIAFKGGKECACSGVEEQGAHVPPGSPKAFSRCGEHQVTRAELCPAPAVMYSLLLIA